jgi:hypothetical protein
LNSLVSLEDGKFVDKVKKGILLFEFVFECFRRCIKKILIQFYLYLLNKDAFLIQQFLLFYINHKKHPYF